MKEGKISCGAWVMIFVVIFMVMYIGWKFYFFVMMNLLGR
jgi:hypothetical protein